MSSSTRFVLPKKTALLILLLMDVIFFGAFDPIGSSSFIVIFGCLLLALSVYAIADVSVNALSQLFRFTTSVRRRLRLLLTGLTVFLILMQSIGQLSVRDVLAALPLALGAYFYLSYNHANRSKQDDKARI